MRLFFWIPIIHLLSLPYWYYHLPVVYILPRIIPSQEWGQGPDSSLSIMLNGKELNSDLPSSSFYSFIWQILTACLLICQLLILGVGNPMMHRQIRSFLSWCFSSTRGRTKKQIRNRLFWAKVRTGKQNRVIWQWVLWRGGVHERWEGNIL